MKARKKGKPVGRKGPGMKGRFRDLISVCIFAKADGKSVNESIKHAAELTDNIFLVCENVEYPCQGVNIPSGIIMVSPESLGEVLKKEWVFFLMDDERIVVRDWGKISETLKDARKKTFGVYVKDASIVDLLKHYQFISNLGQFQNISDLAFTTKVETRIARKEIAGEIAHYFKDREASSLLNMDGIIHGVNVEPYPSSLDTPVIQDEPEIHDLKCLKGEIYYGPEPGEEVDELSNVFNGFRVFRDEYLDGFMESARLGLGIDEMYVPMLNYLIKNGNFTEAKELFDLWMTKRKGDATSTLYTLGGMISAHLLYLNDAIRYYTMAVEIYPDASTYSAMGKLHLINNDRDKAIECFSKAVEMNPQAEGEKYILSVIRKGDWRPLSLSVCIIARDEEKNIAEAIESAKFVADEVIVVDTGSEDRTRQVAAAHGAKIIETPWNDDFSEVRNSGINECGGDYIFMLDADESIDIRDRVGLAIFKRLLPVDKNTAYRTKITVDANHSALSVSLLSKFVKQLPIPLPVRLFPRVKDIYYTGAAFEAIDTSLEKQGILIEEADLFKITHRKDNDSWRDQRKMSAVQKTFHALNDSSAAIDGGLYHLKLGDMAKAFQWFDKINNGHPGLMSKIAFLYLSQNDYESANQIIRKSLEAFPDAPELKITQGAVYFMEDRYRDVVDLLYSIVQTDMASLETSQRCDAHFYYGISLLETDQVAEGIEYLARALEGDPIDFRYRIGGLYAFARAEQWDSFFEIAGKMVEDENLKIDFVVEDFSRVCRIMAHLFHHFSKLGRLVEAKVAERILYYIVNTKISSAGEIEMLKNHIDDFDHKPTIQGITNERYS